MKSLIELVEAAQRKDIDAFTAIVQQFQDMAMGYAYSILKDFQLAEDVAQEAFVQTYLSLQQLREPAAFPGWFRKIVFKHSDRIRRKHQVINVPLEAIPELSSGAQTPHRKLEQQEEKNQVHIALQALPDIECQVATLFYISEYSRQDIANFLQVPLATVIYRLRSARTGMKRRILEMSKQALRADAPSRDKRFMDNVVGRLQIMEKLHDVFTDSLSITLSEAFGKQVETNTAYLDLPTYSEVVKRLSHLPSCTYTIAIGPSGGNAIVSFFSSVVRALLRSGASDSSQLTQEEIHDFDSVTDEVLTNLETAWKQHKVILKNPVAETDPEKVNLAASDEPIVFIGIEINVEDYSTDYTNPRTHKGKMPAACLCYPVSTLESVLSQFEVA